MGSAAPAAGDAARGHRETAWVAAIAAGVTVAWTLFALGQLGIGPSEWDDAMYCERAATGSVAWDIRNRYVHVWGLRAMFALTPNRELGAQIYALFCVCSLGVLALLVGRRIAGLRCGLIAMGATLVSPTLLKYATVPHVDLTLALWVACATLAAVWAGESAGRKALSLACAAGAATVLALKSKETALVLLPVLAVVLWPHRARARGLLGAAAVGAAVAAALVWLAHSTLDASGSPLSSANVGDYFARRPVIPRFETTQAARAGKLKHDLVHQLTTSAMLPLTLLGVRGLVTGFGRDPFIRALTGLAIGVGVFTSYIAYASPNIQVEDRYLAALVLPLCIGAAYAVELLLRTEPEAEGPLHDLPNIAWLLPLVLVLCVLSARGLWVWASGGEAYSERAAMLFLVPTTTLVLFATPWLTNNRWLPRAGAAALLLIVVGAGMGAAKRHRSDKAVELAPWRALAVAADAGSGKVAVTRGGHGATRVRFRLRSLSRRAAGHIQTRNVPAPAAANPDELLLDARRQDKKLLKAGYRVVARSSGRRGNKGTWTAYRPPPR